MVDHATHSPATTPSRTPLGRFLDRLASLSIAVAAVSLLGLVMVQGWQVFARYVLNDSPSWTEPVTLVLLATCMSFGAAAAVHEDRHFRFHLLAQALPSRARHAVDLLAVLVVVAIGVVLAGWGLLLLADGFAIRMAGAPLPQSITFLPLAIGGVLMAMFALGRLVPGAAPVVRVAEGEG